jgi:hypothetical protein
MFRNRRLPYRANVWRNLLEELLAHLSASYGAVLALCVEQPPSSIIYGRVRVYGRGIRKQSREHDKDRRAHATAKVQMALR